MAAYGNFAYYYDRFMDGIPYDEWADYLRNLLHNMGIRDGLVLELGCGTGQVTRRMKNFGYDMIGLDISEEMLEIAIGQETDSSILYIQQDMREFELFGTVRGVISICDSMNYITEPEDLVQVFRLVNNYLERGGCFIFDFHTEYYYRSELGCDTFVDNREDGSLIWENFYDEDEKINEYDITIYAKEQKDSYRRFSETHYQRSFTVEQMKNLAETAGMEFVAAYDAFTMEEPKQKSTRVYMIVKETFQEGKTYL